MDWTIEPTDHHTLTMGTCVATVWPSGNHRYASMVIAESMSTVHYGFITVEGAQAWRLTQLAELRMSGECGSTAVASDTDKAG